MLQYFDDQCSCNHQRVHILRHGGGRQTPCLFTGNSFFSGHIGAFLRFPFFFLSLPIREHMLIDNHHYRKAQCAHWVLVKRRNRVYVCVGVHPTQLPRMYMNLEISAVD